MVLFEAKNHTDELDLVIKNKFEKLETEKKLAIVQIGNDKPSKKFVNIKKNLADSYGIELEVINFKTSTKKSEVFETLENIGSDSGYGGLVVQYPFPQKFNYKEIALRIDPSKDVDFFNPTTYGHFALNTKDEFLPPTVRALDFIINNYKMETRAKTYLLLGQGPLVGKPLANYLINNEATIISTNQYTEDKEKIISDVDVVVSAVGDPNWLKGEDLKRGSCVVDFGGGNKEFPGVGDFDMDSDYSHLSIVSPSPGGAGPLTVRFLFLNFLEFVEKQQEEEL